MFRGLGFIRLNIQARMLDANMARQGRLANPSPGPSQKFG